MRNKIFIKSPEQISNIRASCQLAAKTLKFIGPYVQPGITTGGQPGLLQLFANYKKECAKKRGHTFSLTLEEFRQITLVIVIIAVYLLTNMFEAILHIYENT